MDLLIFRTKLFLRVLSVATLLLVSAPNLALEPSGISLGSGWGIYPSVTYGVIEDSNPYRQDSDGAESATVTKIRPEVEVKLDTGVGLYGVNYWMEQGAYSTNANDNYTDQLLELEGRRSFGRRIEGVSSIAYKLGHDSRGAGVDEGVVALEDVFYPDKFRELSFKAALEYGADASTLGVQGYTSVLDKNYLNNFDRGTADREYVDQTVGAIGYLYVSPITDALVEVRRSRIDYQSPNQVAQDKEGVINTYFIGGRWDVSGKTTGSIKIGQTNRLFDSKQIETNESFSWEVALEWSPKAYSVVSLETSRGSKETSGPGVFVMSDDLNIIWSHSYSVFFSMELEVGYENDDYYSDSDIQREDEIFSFGGKVIYSPSRSMDLGFNMGREVRSSDLEGLDYNKFLMGIELSLAI